MSSPFNVYMYRDARGKAPLEDLVKRLRKSNKRAAVKADALVRLLERQGTSLRLPHVSNVSGPIYEPRGRPGHDPVRLYYFQMSATEFMIVCGEVKEQSNADPKLIELALRAHDEHGRRKKNNKERELRG